jgi:integrase
MADYRKRGKNWYYRFVDADGRRLERKGCPDRRVTERMAHEAEARAAMQRAGLIDPKAERLADAGRRSIRDHLADFLATLTAKGDDPKHIRTTATYIRRVLELAGAERIRDLTPGAITQALSRLTDAKGRRLSARTINYHATSIKAFARWLWREGRSADHPLVALGKLNEEKDRRLVRRVLDEAELRRLLDAARTAPPWRGMPGPDRAWFYAIAAATGLRRSELASLTPASFRLDAEPPTIVCEAGFTKNGERAEQPIPPALADALSPWLASRAPDRVVFDPLPEKTGQMLKADLARTGIGAVDASGHVVDMHSLRHGYVTVLARAGVPTKTLQTLARHSDPRLTLNVYAHLSVFDTAAALDALPDLTSPGTSPEPLAMTGTDAAAPINDRLAPYLPHTGDGIGQDAAAAGGIEGSCPDSAMGHKPLNLEEIDAARREQAASDESAPRRTRTYNPLIKSQLLCLSVAGGN